MGNTFRDAMTWLHTWAGVVFSGLLFAIFWMGTLSVYDREIDRWMMPMTRLPAPETRFSADAIWKETGSASTGSPYWRLYLPTAREPTARIIYADAKVQDYFASLTDKKTHVP